MDRNEPVTTEWERCLAERPGGDRFGLWLVVLILAVGLGLAGDLLAGPPAHAQQLSCESIKDPDRRHWCRATTGGPASECEFIRNADLRAECRAVLRARKK